MKHLFPHAHIKNELGVESPASQLALVKSLSLAPIEPVTPLLVSKRITSTQPVYERVDSAPKTMAASTAPTPPAVKNCQIPRRNLIAEAIRMLTSPTTEEINTDSKDSSVEAAIIHLPEVIVQPTAITQLPKVNTKTTAKTTKSGRPPKHDVALLKKKYEQFKKENLNGLDKEFANANGVSERTWFRIKKN